jgi:hypothetical protein
VPLFVGELLEIPIVKQEGHLINRSAVIAIAFLAISSRMPAAAVSNRHSFLSSDVKRKRCGRARSASHFDFMEQGLQYASPGLIVD